MSLVASSPLIGSWADQPMDERQMKLIEQQAAATAARRAQAQGAKSSSSTSSSAQLVSPQQTPAQQQQQQQQPGAEDEGPPPLVHGDANALTDNLGNTYGPFYINPNRPMRPEFQALLPQPQHNGLQAGPAGGWGQAGKLKEMARDVFERAYGLNGRTQEDHEALCEEVMLATMCSRKSFAELVYGHSYAAELGDLRALVPGYRPKERRKRDASERGRGGKAKRLEGGDGFGQARQNGSGATGAGTSRSLFTRIQQTHSPPQSNVTSPHRQSQLHSNFLSRGSPAQNQSNVIATVENLPQTHFVNGQPIHQNPTIHLSHRLIPSSQNLQPAAALHTYQAHHPQQQQPLLPSTQLSPQQQPLLTGRFAPPPPIVHSAPQQARRLSPAPSPQLAPMSSTGGGGSTHASPLLAPQRRSVDATNAMIAAVAAANSVSPHLASLGDPSSNPPLPMVPSSPALAPVTGAALKSTSSAAKVVGSPLRQSMTPAQAAAVVGQGSALPPRASPVSNPQRGSIINQQGYQFSSPQPSPILIPMRVGGMSPTSPPPRVNSPSPINSPITSPSHQAAAKATPVSPPAATPAPTAAKAEAKPTPSEAEKKSAAAAAKAQAEKARLEAEAKAAADREAEEVAAAIAAAEEAERLEVEQKAKEVAAALEARAKAEEKKQSPTASMSKSQRKKAKAAAAAAAAVPSSSAESTPDTVPAADLDTEAEAEAAEAGDEDEAPSSSSNAEKKRRKKERAKQKKLEEQAKAEAETKTNLNVAVEKLKSPRRSNDSSPPTHVRTSSLKKKISATPPTSPPQYSLLPESRATAAALHATSSSSSATAASVSNGNTALTHLILLTFVGSALFVVTRSYVGQVLYDSSSSSSASQSWTVVAALYLGSLFIYMWLFRAAHDAQQVWSALILELSNQLDKYVTTWSLLAVDDNHQLLAAINQVQTLLDAALASFTGLSSSPDKTHAVAALEHAVQTMDFLHLAHRNLIFELGSTQPIMRLVGSLGIVRNKLMHVRSKATAGTIVGKQSNTTKSAATTTPMTLLLTGLFLLNALALLFAPPLTSSVLNLGMPLGLISILSVVLLLVWSAQYPFAGVDPLASTPSNILGLVGINVLVSLEPLQYLRARLAEKAAETQERIDHPELYPQQAAILDEEEGEMEETEVEEME